MSTKRQVVLTGMRTTGALHLGHFKGALENWVKIQNSGRYECYFLLADIQALTTHADRPELLTTAVKDVVLDWLSVGLDPTLPHVHFVLQSQVVGRADLSIALGMVAKYSEVLRNPTLKAERRRLKNETIGFVYYPVDQAADIYMVCPTPPQEGDEVLVPVGKDQEAHLELAREIARDFNRRYGSTFTPCSSLIGEIGTLVGTDGKRKMGKSEGNAILLSDDAETVTRKVMGMFTDPKRVRADIPGNTRRNPVFIYHRAFNPNKAEVADLGRRYRAGKVGDVEVKQKLAQALNDFLDPIRERRAKFADADIAEIVMAGTDAASGACGSVIERVREVMHLQFPIASG